MSQDDSMGPPDFSGDSEKTDMLADKLIRRHSSPVGLIDVRHPQQKYTRTAGWMAERFSLVASLTNRHEAGAEQTAGGNSLVMRQSAAESAGPFIQSSVGDVSPYSLSSSSGSSGRGSPNISGSNAIETASTPKWRVSRKATSAAALAGKTDTAISPYDDIDTKTENPLRAAESIHANTSPEMVFAKQNHPTATTVDGTRESSGGSSSQSGPAVSLAMQNARASSVEKTDTASDNRELKSGNERSKSTLPVQNSMAIERTTPSNLIFRKADAPVSVAKLIQGIGQRPTPTTASSTVASSVNQATSGVQQDSKEIKASERLISQGLVLRKPSSTGSGETTGKARVEGQEISSVTPSASSDLVLGKPATPVAGELPEISAGNPIPPPSRPVVSSSVAQEIRGGFSQGPPPLMIWRKGATGSSVKDDAIVSTKLGAPMVARQTAPSATAVPVAGNSPVSDQSSSKTGGQLDIESITENVIRSLESRLTVERERRGLRQ